MLHLSRPRVTPGALLIDIMSKIRCFIYWDYEWYQVLYWLRLWVREGVSFIETTSDTRCFIANKHNSYPKMSVKWPPACNWVVLFISVDKWYIWASLWFWCHILQKRGQKSSTVHVVTWRQILFEKVSISIHNKSSKICFQQSKEIYHTWTPPFLFIQQMLVTCLSLIHVNISTNLLHLKWMTLSHADPYKEF